MKHSLDVEDDADKETRKEEGKTWKEHVKNLPTLHPSATADGFRGGDVRIDGREFTCWYVKIRVVSSCHLAGNLQVPVPSVTINYIQFARLISY